MRSSLSSDLWLRGTLAAVVAVSAAIAAGCNTEVLKTSSIVNGANGEENLADALDPDQRAVLKSSTAASQPTLADEGPMPDLGGAVGWLNSAPLSRKSLRGKIVLVDFWTCTCINSLRPLRYVKSSAGKYRDAGLVVIAVHTPEFSFEKERPNVENALRDLNVTYPVAMDNNYAIWQPFNNQYWPAQYLIDGKGQIRYHHFGEGENVEIERVIQRLLRENGATGLQDGLVSVSGAGVEAAEVTTRLPGRIDLGATSFGSTCELASALRRVACAHGKHEKRIGIVDANWPDWYAAYVAAQQAGTKLPK